MKTCYVIGDGLLTSLCIQRLMDDARWKVLGLVSNAVFLKEKWINSFSIYDNLIDFKIDAKSFDYLFSIINPKLLPKDILNMAKYFSINYHSSLLPKYAGWDPIPWVILRNEKKHGITWHVMTEKIDDDEQIILQVPIQLDSNETTKTLHLKCFKAGLSSFERLLDTLENKEKISFPLQDKKARSYFSRKKKPDNLGFIDWNLSAEEVNRFCRAFYFGGQVNWVVTPKLKLGSNIYIVEKIKSLPIRSFSKPGTFVSIDEKCLVISSQTTDVMITVLRDLYGNIVSSLDLKINIGKPIHIENQLFDWLRRSKRSYIDEYWLSKEFSSYAPLKIKGIPAMEKDIEENITIKLKTERRDFSEQVSTLLFYLSKFTQKKCISIKLDYYNKNFEAPRALKKIFCKDTPLNFYFKDYYTFDDLRSNVGEILNKNHCQMFYFRDFFYRYKSLLKDKEKIFFDEKFSITLCDSNDYYEVKDTGIQILFFKNGDAKIISNQDSREFSFFVENIKRQLPALHKKLLKNNKESLKNIQLLSKEEEEKITIGWNSKKVNYDFRSLYELISRVADEFPEKIAIKTTAGVQLSYKSLVKKAEDMAHALFYNYKLAPQHQVCICMGRTQHLIILILALLRLNCVIIPISSFSTIKKMSGSIKIKAFITDNFNLHLECQSKKQDIFSIEFYDLYKKGSYLNLDFGHLTSIGKLIDQ